MEDKDAFAGTSRVGLYCLVIAILLSTCHTNAKVESILTEIEALKVERVID